MKIEDRANEPQPRFVALESEAEVGEVAYRAEKSGGESSEESVGGEQSRCRVLVLTRVEVGAEYRGTGKAREMMRCLSDYLREQKIRVSPLCPYAVAFYKRNPEYSDLLLEE